VSKIDLLAPGDLVILYSDGLSDLLSGTYVSQRLEGVIGTVRDQSASEITECVRTDVLGVDDREDDVTVVVIKRSVT
jgi:serine phosphatase RsbU (regulator of sigma subunit)